MQQLNDIQKVIMMILTKKIFKNKLAVGILWIPFAVFSAYTLMIAEDRYVSNSSIVVQNVGGNIELGGFGALFPGVSNNSTTDLLLIREYLASRDMLNEIDAKFNIINHWSSPSLDYVYKLNTQDYKELSLRYYQDKVRPVYDVESGTLRLSVETFDPKLSKNVLDYVLVKAEGFVNEKSHKSAHEQVSFIEKELVNIKTKLDESRKALIDFQRETNFFTPESETQQTSKKLGVLEENKLRAEAEYSAKKTFLHSDSPQMITLAESIRFFEKQIEVEKQKLIGNFKENDSQKTIKGGKYSKLGINDRTDMYKMLEGELNLNIEAYKNALITYEKVKLDATRKLKQLVLVSSPQTPDYPLYPNKKLNILYAFIVLSLIYGLAVLIKDIIKEHK